MARYRLTADHYMHDQIVPAGATVGDDTSFPISGRPSMFMAPLDEEAKKAVEARNSRPPAYTGPAVHGGEGGGTPQDLALMVDRLRAAGFQIEPPTQSPIQHPAAGFVPTSLPTPDPANAPPADVNAPPPKDPNSPAVKQETLSHSSGPATLDEKKAEAVKAATPPAATPTKEV